MSNDKLKVSASGAIDKETKRMVRFQIEGDVQGVLYMPKGQAVGIAGIELTGTLKPGK